MIEKIKIECPACNATGVYCGFCEPKGTGVVCVQCDGTGCQEVRFTPFTKRRLKRGVKTIRRSRGTFIATGVGPVGGSVSYEEFLDGKMPS